MVNIVGDFMALASLSSSSCSWLNLIGPNSNKSGGWRGGGAKEEPSTSRNSCEIPQGICGSLQIGSYYTAHRERGRV